MDLHRSYAGEFDISEEELESELMAPTTQGYTDFLVRTAAQGDFAELVVALLPCMWGFSEIGQRLAEGGRPSDERYTKWIDMYSSAEFAELATWCRTLTDRVAGELSPQVRERGRRRLPHEQPLRARVLADGRGRESAGSPNQA